jgi:Ni/Co efflux regulator RcnB
MQSHHFITGVHMKIKALVIAAAVLLTSGASAFAQHYEDRGDRYERRDRYENDDRGDRYDRVYRDYGRRDGYYRHRVHGAGPYNDIHAGERLPHAFWGPRHVVWDWQRYGLRAPYRGHRWIRTGDDFVMSSVHTGIVARVVVRR